MPPTAFFDLDGTLVCSDMHHLVFFFLRSLPRTPFHVAKLALFCLLMPWVVAIHVVFGEAYSAMALAWLALFGLNTDVVSKVAESKVLPWLNQRLRPQMLEEIKRHKEAGVVVVVLSGNIHPLILPFAESLGCKCSATRVRVLGARYTGLVVGTACVQEEKIKRVMEWVEKKDLPACSGYGNSKNDLPFLKIVGSPFVVTPDPVLKQKAKEFGWSSKFVTVTEPAVK